MKQFTDEAILALAADHKLPVRFPHEVVAFARELMAQQVGVPDAALEEAAAICDAMVSSSPSKAFQQAGAWLAARIRARRAANGAAGQKDGAA